jgi:ATP-dependent DNA helicase RecG
MDNPGNLYGKVHPDNFPNENDYRNPVIAVAMKTLGYVNQFGRGVETVQEELKANKNGLAVFKFDDITTFKVIVMSADPIEEGNADDAGNSIDKTEIEQRTEKNVGDESEMSRR